MGGGRDGGERESFLKQIAVDFVGNETVWFSLIVQKTQPSPAVVFGMTVF